MAIVDQRIAPSSQIMLDSRSRLRDTMKSDEEKTIHSGHFMISQIHDPGIDDDEDNKDDDSLGYDFMEATKETSKTYRFGPRSTQTLAIDASLTKLFQCLTLAYSGKITSPKWKAFRGMHLTIKDKIRLNNIIWREWHLQYLFGRKPSVCQFATPLSDDIHTKPEAVVLEGKYWKRRLDTVTAEYKKWRRYYKDRLSKSVPDRQMQEVATIAELLERVKDSNVPHRPTINSSTDLLISGDFEDMDFSDNLFTLKEPFMFPNPRELSQFVCADLIQPGLIQLQPNLEDFMDVDSVHDMIMNSTKTNFLSGSSGSSDVVLSGSVAQPFTSDQTQSHLMMDQQQLSVLQQPYAEPTSSLEYQIMQALNSDQSGVDLSMSQFGTPEMAKNLIKEPVKSVTVPQPVRQDQQGLTLVTDPQVGVSQSSTAVSQAPGHLKIRNLLANKSPVQRIAAKPAPPPQPTPVRPALVPQEINTQKKDGFIVPLGKPVQTPRKQRTIAPAPPAKTSPPTSSPSSSVQSTYLAQLLTKGVYPGAIVSVKKEPVTSGQTAGAMTTTYQPIRPADPSRSPKFVSQQPNSPVASGVSVSSAPSPIPFDLTKVSTSFPTSVLIAAASQALGSSSVSVKDVLSLSPKPNSCVLASSPLSDSPQSPQSQPPTSPLSGIMSPLSGLMSPGKSDVVFGGETEKVVHHEQRRVAHLSAEQKRRCNLKSGFDMLHTLVPALSLNPKVSKATMLQKTADYCKKLKSERGQMQKEAEILKQEIESLNSAISMVQSQLPETGVPVTRQRVDQMKDMFDTYVRNRTMTNWKFWIFSIIIGNLFDSYNNTVSTASIDELCRTVLAWLDQNCSLVSLRPTVLNALRHLSTTTSILTEPGRMKEQATQAVTKGSLLSTSNNSRT